MKYKSLLLPAVLMLPGFAFGQAAIDALSLARQDLRGTARFMSMGGAFGALGGDLTTLSQNPAGIGVYRNHELGFTLNLDAQSATSDAGAASLTTRQTKFYLNNIGGVLTLKLRSDAVPNINFGFTYNKTASFNRAYQGSFGALQTSMSNWMAGVSNANELTVADVTTTDTYDPYNPNDGGYAAPWISILGYDSWLINPTGNPNQPNWEGVWGSGTMSNNGTIETIQTSGIGQYTVEEKGGIDSFNIALGGNFGNLVYWGMDFDITNINYERNTLYAESLQNAFVMGDAGVEPVSADWNLKNYYRINGSGFAYKFGLIFRPIQELRLGFAFHTPTFYSLNQEFGASTAYNYNNEGVNQQYTNGAFPGSYDFRFRSPWKVMVSAAGVIGSHFIISADYEWAQFSRMKYNDPNYASYYYDDYYYGNWNYTQPANSYDLDGTNASFRQYLSDTSTFRVGAEFRITSSFSIRAGYSYVSSPVKEAVRDGLKTVATAGTQPSYLLDNSTSYITGGIGYRLKGFYADLAYVYKHTDATYWGFTPDPTANVASPSAKLGFNQNQIVLSMGYKF